MNNRLIIFGVTFFLLIPSIILPIPIIKTNPNIDPFIGYTLFAPEFSTKTYLIDIEGNEIITWNSTHIQTLGTYLSEDGKLIRSYLPYINPIFTRPGVTGAVEMYDLNDTLLWNFEYSTDNFCLHHDIEILPNGNILMIAWEIKTNEDAIEEGRIVGGNDDVWPDHIIEVEPTYPTGGNIVWEWHIWDHLIQDYDPTKNNYGVIKDHPELLDINLKSGIDWNHMNSVDYNENLEQIIISSRNQNEIWIIDHSTTTEEAAGHTGGRYGQGGDLLYRWGNPQNYNRGDAEDLKFLGQHDAQWIESGSPGEGNILVFINGNPNYEEHYSSVVEIVTPVDEYGIYTIENNLSYGPEDPIWTYIADNPSDFYSGTLSGAQRLPNGNTLICSGNNGKFFEVTEDGEIIWEYTNIYPTPRSNGVFKIRRYSPEYPGLVAYFNKPYTPSPPYGLKTGKIRNEYVYETAGYDPNGDKLYYKWDWGDEISNWEGPYDSGILINSSHIWNKKGDYEIKVKAKDVNGYESYWSYPLEISMSKEKNLLLELLESLENYTFNQIITIILKNIQNLRINN